MGLWSSKIHNVVQPRKHFLAEPPDSPFVPRLQDLVNQPDSRYHLLDWDPKQYWQPHRFIAEGLLPGPSSHASRESNSSLLFLANAAMPSKSPRRRPISTLHYKLLDWSRGIRTASGFHANGPVRMLLWCHEKDKTSILPRTFIYRTKLSLLLEMTNHVEEIVSSDISLGLKYQKREQRLELLSGRRVADTMHQLGIHIPAERRTDLQKEIHEALAQLGSDRFTSLTPSSSLQSRAWHKELQELRDRFDAGELVQAEGQAPRSRRKVKDPSTLTPEYLRLVELERNARHDLKRHGLVDGLLARQAKIDSLDLKVHNHDLDEATRAAALSEMRREDEELKRYLQNTKGVHTRQKFEYFKHDRRAYAQNPPLLMWDRRNAEPLKANSEEFYPPKGLCLFDIQPRQPFLYRMTSAQDSIFSALMTTLWYSAPDTLKVLDQIAPGAFDALTSRVPTVWDPRRGGERDLADLPLRRVTPDMAYGLVEAWQDWPFRPDLLDLLRKGNLYGDERDED
ncbi:MAG: hypothetical protein Q9174_000213 [Haloplaca sp. 1 TL-2023]